MTRTGKSKATSGSKAPILIVNGWSIFAHPEFLQQLERLVARVEAERKKKPDEFRKSPPAKLLAQLVDLVFRTIPANPTRSEYRQGDALGANNKHWFRAYLGNKRFRLFFRYSSAEKIIIFGWLNDEDTLRTYGSRTDAYAVFRKMLEKDCPPNSWDDLLAEASRDVTIDIAQKLRDLIEFEYQENVSKPKP